MLVTGNFFSVMGVSRAWVALSSPKKTLYPDDAVVILGHEFWEKEFGSDRSIL